MREDTSWGPSNAGKERYKIIFGVRMVNGAHRSWGRYMTIHVRRRWVIDKDRLWKVDILS